MKKDMIDIPFGTSDSELKGFEYTIPEGYEAKIRGGKVIVRKAESEDERIRKEIIKLVKFYYGSSLMCKHTVSKDDMVTWLEKRGEQKPAVDTKVIVPKFRAGDIVKSKSQPMLSPRKIISIGKDCYWCEDRGCIGFAWEDDYEIVEQNPAWSKEDETRLTNTIIMLKEGASHHFIKDDIAKEVDLDAEIMKYQREIYDRDTTIRDVAKHFFELGIQVGNLNKRE